MSIPLLTSKTTDFSIKTLITLITCLLVSTIYVEETVAQGMLWKVTDTTGQQLYLAGVLSFSKSEDGLPSNYQRAFDDAQKIGFDLHPDSILAEYQLLFMEEGFYDADDHLENHLPPALYKKLDQRLETLGHPLGHHPRMKPWLIALSFDQPEKEAAGFKSEGLAELIYQTATEEEKEIFSLRSTSSFQNLIAKLTSKKQLDYLKYRVNTSKKNVKNLDKSYAFWLQGKDKKLQRLLNQRTKGFSKSLYQSSVIRKNKKWISELAQLISADETTLMVLPAEHLIGQQSLISLLKKEGFTLERL